MSEDDERIVKVAPTAPDPEKRAYNIVIEPNLIASAGRRMRKLGCGDRVIVVTDETIETQTPHWETLASSLNGEGFKYKLISVKPGEASKTFDQYRRILEEALAFGVDRRATVVALGGGVVGDLAGYVAATLLRGVNFVQIPTTLLAQVDSSVGGKTAIDVGKLKNMVGAFHQPRLVLADLDVLRTLPSNEISAGFAEVVKYGLLGDLAFFEWLETNSEKLLQGDPDLVAHAVQVSCEMKAGIVARDETEHGERKLLNLGHTFGHAFEAELGIVQGGLLHGEAVAIGMTLAFRHSARARLTDMATADRVEKALQSFGLPTTLARFDNAKRPSVDTLMGHMLKDKKTVGGAITLILANGIGDAIIEPNADAAAIRETLEEALSR